jgi:RES domain-containing protein
VTGLPVPPEASDLADFPSTTWTVAQRLWRVHLERHSTVHFAADQGGRFNPSSPQTGFGTWYLSSHPNGAVAEVFGRLRMITRAQLDERVLAEVWLPSDVRLADLTHPSVVGRYGITNELSMGGESVYPVAQRWATALWQAGFSGVLYAGRFDVTLQTRSIALFGKAEDEAQFEETTRIGPLHEIAEEMVALYGYSIISGRSL